MFDRQYVNITIVTFNRLDYTRQCIESVIQTADFPYVITVVDNGSTDGSVEWLQSKLEQKWIKNLILHQYNKGVATAANDGWEAEDCDFYLKLDNDIVFRQTGWLRPMIETISSCSRIGALAYNVEAVPYPLVELDGVYVKIKHGNLGGCCIMIPRWIHEQLGFWCEDYGLYGEEDTDYGVRILLSGLLNCYMPDEDVAVHLPDGLDKAYRLFKDGQRRRNFSIEGPFLKNAEAYVTGARSLYVARPKPSQLEN